MPGTSNIGQRALMPILAVLALACLGNLLPADQTIINDKYLHAAWFGGLTWLALRLADWRGSFVGALAAIALVTLVGAGVEWAQLEFGRKFEFEDMEANLIGSATIGGFLWLRNHVRIFIHPEFSRPVLDPYHNHADRAKIIQASLMRLNLELDKADQDIQLQMVDVHNIDQLIRQISATESHAAPPAEPADHHTSTQPTVETSRV